MKKKKPGFSTTNITTLKGFDIEEGGRNHKKRK
jgi:hypothetical protein